MPDSERKSNRRLQLSEDAFRVMVGGIAVYSLHTQRLETLSSAFEFGVTNKILPSPEDITHFRGMKYEGDIRVHLSINERIQGPYETFRDHLATATGSTWSTRDVATIVCMAVARQFSHLQ